MVVAENVVVCVSDMEAEVCLVTSVGKYLVGIHLIDVAILVGHITKSANWVLIVQYPSILLLNFNNQNKKLCQLKIILAESFFFFVGK